MNAVTVQRLYTRGSSSSWYADFLVNGKRKRLSVDTPVSESESVARAQADGMAKAMLLSLGGGYTLENRQTLANMDRAVNIASGSASSIPTLREFLADFLASRKDNRRSRTNEGTGHAVGLFMKFIGDRADAKIDKVTQADVIGWRDDMKKRGLVFNTIEMYFIRCSVVFTAAIDRGVIFRNPFKRDSRHLVEIPPDTVKKPKKKGLYAADALKICRYFEVGEELTIVRWAYYHGMRLGDCCSIRWANVDLDRGLLVFEPRKQVMMKEARTVETPLHPAMAAHLATLECKGEFVLPEYAELYAKKPKAATLRFFYAHRDEGIESFHSFRHGFISTLANAGIEKDLRQRLVNHAPDDVHGVYTHFSDAKLLSALKKIPKF